MGVCGDDRSPKEVAERLDRLIERIREIHQKGMGEGTRCDVLLVSFFGFLIHWGGGNSAVKWFMGEVGFVCLF